MVDNPDNLDEAICDIIEMGRLVHLLLHTGPMAGPRSFIHPYASSIFSSSLPND